MSRFGVRSSSNLIDKNGVLNIEPEVVKILSLGQQFDSGRSITPTSIDSISVFFCLEK
jgi:hypothetical protein